MVRVVWREQRRDRCHRRQPVGAVLVVLAPLVQHDLTLVVELRGRERGEQVPHAVRLHPQRELERARRHDLPVVGAIGVRRSVEQRSRLLQRMEVSLVVVRRPFEHQVLEEVREAGAARRLVLRPHVIPHVHRHDRAVVILVNDHRQAVWQRVAGVGDLHRVLTRDHTGLAPDAREAAWTRSGSYRQTRPACAANNNAGPAGGVQRSRAGVAGVRARCACPRPARAPSATARR